MPALSFKTLAESFQPFQPAMAQSNLILGYATNCTAAAIHPFVVSARRWHRQEDCRLALFVTPGRQDAPALHELASQYGIDLLPATSQWNGPRSRLSKIGARGALAWWRFWDGKSGAPADISRQIALAAWLHPHYTRWFDYTRYLQLLPSFHQIFLSDVTDVLFQGNVFEQLGGEGLTIPALPLVYDERNVDSDWMRNALGAARLAELRGKPVLCIGTVGGSAAVVATLCDKMWRTFDSLPHSGIEQAYFNDLYYRGELGAASIRTNDDPFVLTITSPAECPRLVTVDQGFTHGPKAPAVVHMYNRLPPEWKPQIDSIVAGRVPAPMAMPSSL